MAKHPVTGMELEDGHGALPEYQQVVQHLHYIEQTKGEEVADAMRAEMGLPTAKEEREAAAAATAAGTGSAHELARHDDRLTALEVNASEHKALAERIAKLEHDMADTLKWRTEPAKQEALTAPPQEEWKPQEFKPMTATESEPHGSRE